MALAFNLEDHRPGYIYIYLCVDVRIDFRWIEIAAKKWIFNWKIETQTEIEIQQLQKQQ